MLMFSMCPRLRCWAQNGWIRSGGPVDGIEGRLGRLLEAVLAVAEGLDLDAVLDRVVFSACGLVDARYGALGVIDERSSDGRLSSFVHHGMDDETVARLGDLPTGKGLLGQLIRDPRVLRLDDLRRHPAASGLPEGHPPMGSFIGAPIRVWGDVFGNLYVTEKRGGGTFSAEDEAAVVALAAVAGSAIANVRLVARSRELSVVRERDRIARDLHDTVIQNLYATGLGLQAAQRSSLGLDDVQARITRAIESIDATVKEIRATIFALQDDPSTSVGARTRVLAVIEEMASLLGFQPRLRLDGPIDTVVGAELVEEIVPVLRESLTNVAKHARASTVTVRLEVLDGHLELEVIDDGVGLPEQMRPRGMGVENIRDRASLLGGAVEFASVESGGTRMSWRSPL
jgi:signal transduction histidine kinase